MENIVFFLLLKRFSFRNVTMINKLALLLLLSVDFTDSIDVAIFRVLWLRLLLFRIQRCWVRKSFFFSSSMIQMRLLEMLLILLLMVSLAHFRLVLLLLVLLLLLLVLLLRLLLLLLFVPSGAIAPIAFSSDTICIPVSTIAVPPVVANIAIFVVVVFPTATASVSACICW